MSGSGLRPFSKVMKWESLFLRSNNVHNPSTISGKSFPFRTAATYCETLPTFGLPSIGWSSSTFGLPSIGWSSPIAKSPFSPAPQKIILFRMDIGRRTNLPVFGPPSIGWSSLIVKSPFSSVPRKIFFVSNGYCSSPKVLFPTVLTLAPF